MSEYFYIFNEQRNNMNRFKSRCSSPEAYVEEWLYRGFTGHEHFPEFGLINMNGRMYDPLIGRMLSPDNFVQSPDYSQSYNRYSYCWNNPLKFTDPSGQKLDNFLRSLVNMHVLPFRAAHAPINYSADYGVHSGLYLSIESGNFKDRNSFFAGDFGSV